jgi:hypothetical protein
MVKTCYYCGKRFKSWQSLTAHWRWCGIYRAIKMGYLPNDFSLASDCKWFPDGNPYLDEEKLVIGQGPVTRD